ncbi:replication initiator protein [Capybara microvirus Cap1_SP_131]|nr:replication initiator protein [Capybara microvirus Cap1_SP_131]
MFTTFKKDEYDFLVPEYAFNRRRQLFPRADLPGLVNPIDYENSQLDLSIPCRTCIGCRLDQSRQWADRMMIELDHSKCGIFVTLTYDPAFAHPCSIDSDDRVYYSLDVRDTQLFNKSLRKAFPDRKIRFFLAGEYGPSTWRPHYHAVYFGLSIDDFPDLMPLKRTSAGSLIYTSEKLQKLWKRGFISLSPVSWQTCAYVARYTTKKLIDSNPLMSDYDLFNMHPEFMTCSRKPGLSGYFYDDHPDLVPDSIDDFKIYIRDPDGLKPVKSVKTPKYLLKQLQAVNPLLYNEYVDMQRVSSEDSLLLKLQRTSLPEAEYILSEEFTKQNSAKKLIRSDL